MQSGKKTRKRDSHRSMAGIIMFLKVRETKLSKATMVVWWFEAISEWGATKSQYIELV